MPTNTKTARGKIRRATSGVRYNPERQEAHLADQFGRAYNAWCERLGLAKWDSSPNLRREV